MKTIKILTLILLFVAMGFVNKVNAQSNDGIYYYCWAEHSETGKYIITEVQYIEIDDCTEFRHRNHYQTTDSFEYDFEKYIKANYNGKFDYGVGFRKVYADREDHKTEKNKLEKDRRETMSEASIITKIFDYEYLCE